MKQLKFSEQKKNLRILSKAYSPISSGHDISTYTGPRSPVGNVPGYRCEADCRSRGREFDPGPVPYFVEIDHEIISTVILLPSAE